MSVLEMQQKAAEMRSELQAVKAQIGAFDRSVQLADLTREQVRKEVGESVAVWQSVGKMFMRSTTAEYEQRLANRTADAREQISALEKKQNYYQTTLTNVTKALKELEN